MAQKYQFGGWHNNPAQGNKNMRFWGNDYWTMGEDPTQGLGENWQSILSQRQPTQQAQSQQPTQQAQPQNQQPVSQPRQTQNFEDIVKQALGMLSEANKPAIQGLEAQRPEIGTRYEQLLADVKRGTQENVTQEMTRRGIPISSGMTKDIVEQKLAPQIAQVGAARTAEEQNLNQQIANLQAGGNQNAIAMAMDLYRLQEQLNQEELQRQQYAAEQAWREKTYKEVTLPESQASIANLKKQPTGTQADREAAIKNQLIQAAKGGSTINDLVAQFGGSIDLKELLSLYTSVSPYGPPNEAYYRQILGLDNTTSGSGLNF